MSNVNSIYVNKSPSQVRSKRTGSRSIRSSAPPTKALTPSPSLDSLDSLSSIGSSLTTPPEQSSPRLTRTESQSSISSQSSVNKKKQPLHYRFTFKHPEKVIGNTLSYEPKEKSTLPTILKEVIRLPEESPDKMFSEVRDLELTDSTRATIHDLIYPKHIYTNDDLKKYVKTLNDTVLCDEEHIYTFRIKMDTSSLSLSTRARQQNPDFNGKPLATRVMLSLGKGYKDDHYFIIRTTDVSDIKDSNYPYLAIQNKSDQIKKQLA